MLSVFVTCVLFCGYCCVSLELFVLICVYVVCVVWDVLFCNVCLFRVL